MNIDHEPACGEIGCEPAMNIPVSVKHAECVHCGKDLRRTKSGRWVPFYLDDDNQGEKA